MSDNTADELTIESIIVNGKQAAVNGQMQMKNGHVFAFADFYVFERETCPP